MPVLQFTLEIILTLCGHLRPLTDSIFETGAYGVPSKS